MRNFSWKNYREN